MYEPSWTKRIQHWSSRYVDSSFPPLTPRLRRNQQRFPPGYGYADYTEEGTEKLELNALVQAQGVEGIADHIDRNLPNFVGRKGGFFAGQDYLKTLAANIIDYADTDTNSTWSADYRGADSYPLVNQRYHRYERMPSPSNRVIIKVDFFVEFWNPTNDDVSGFLRYVDKNTMKIRIPFIGDPEFGESTFNVPNFSIRANEYKTVQLASKNYTLDRFQALPEALDSLKIR